MEARLRLEPAPVRPQPVAGDAVLGVREVERPVADFVVQPVLKPVLLVKAGRRVRGLWKEVAARVGASEFERDQVVDLVLACPVSPDPVVAIHPLFGRLGHVPGPARVARRAHLRRGYVRLRLVDVTPFVLAGYVAWLTDEGKQARRLADETVANAVNPVRAALGSAVAEGLLRTNPAAGLRLPHREQVQDDDGEQAKAFSGEQLAVVLALTPARHRALIELLAGTGLRVSEALALQHRHLALDGEQPHVRVRRALVKGTVAPPKSRHGRRNVPLAPSLVNRLRAHTADLPDSPEAAVFATANGTALDADNLRRRMLKPLVEEAGARGRRSTPSDTRSPRCSAHAA